MSIVGDALPFGVVTVLLGNLEAPIDNRGQDRKSIAAAKARADALVDDLAERHNGLRPTEQGENGRFAVAFQRASDAVSCACEMQRQFANEPWQTDLDLRCRIGVHTGEMSLDSAHRYEGPTMNRCARIRDLAHGGQILLSATTAALVADAFLDGLTTRHLGAYELQGMSRPEELYQLCHPDLDDSFPAIASSTVSNLPTPTSTFVGRASELAELQALVWTSRVVTITGAGGSGKSRLALELAVTQSPAWSTWLVELAPIRDARLVPHSVADAIGAEVAGGADPVDVIVRKLRGRPSLLVIDNCEHLLDACAALASALAHSCPDLVVMATSREPLALEGEVTWRIPSLSMPDALALFVDRAQRADTNFELTEATARPVAEICQRVDRLPLAIELAAARCRALSVDQIAASLHERFRVLTGGPRDALPRQRSLEASVAWSYDMLTDLERTMLARLSVFAGSFSYEGALAVCSGGLIEADQVLDAITSLVDRSLVQVEPIGDQQRYRQLETVRAFARERLAEIDDPSAVRDRHLDFALQLASEGSVGFATDAARWAPILRAELDNLRSAIAWAGSSGRQEQVIDLIADLVRFWNARSMYREIDRALRGALFSDEVTADARGRGMAVAAPFAAFGGDVQTAFDFADDARAFSETAGETGGLRAMATALRAWIGIASDRGTNEQIAADIDVALTEAEHCDRATAANVLTRAGAAQLWWSNFDDGRATLERAIQIAPDDDLFTSLLARTWLLNASAAGRVQEFLDDAESAVALGRALGADFMLSACLQLVAWGEVHYGHEDPARQHAAEALEAASRAGLAVADYFALRVDAIVEHRFGTPDLAWTKACDALERSHHMRFGLNEAIDEWLVGATAQRAGKPSLAREHFQSALVLARDPATPYVTGRAHLGLALLDLAADGVETAWQHAHDAVDALATASDRVGALDALDVIAAVAAHSNTTETVARLIGATDACRDQLGIAPFAMTPDERQAVADAVAGAVDDCAQLRAEGSRLTLEEAVTYARRGRGDRNRPSTGWQSLTPTEIDVIRLVAEGLPNAQIGEQLLMSINTVKTHLSHAYTKLSISSRAELAAQATKHHL